LPKQNPGDDYGCGDEEQFSHDDHSPDCGGVPRSPAVDRGAARGSGRTATVVIAKSGYLFAGGNIDPSLPGSPMVGQLYAEFQIPQKLLHPYPIVMIHGGSQTGTNFTGTPHGREGWAQYFLRRGYAVYVVDQVTRGRAGYWTSGYGPVSAPELDRELQRFAAPERYKLWPVVVLSN
jgi:hypothetical protein